MQSYFKIIICLWVVLFTYTPVFGDDVSQRAPSQKHPHGDHPGYPPVEVYLHLSDDFHRAMQAGSQQSTKTLSTHMSEDYLNQISVASRYTVETNLEILKQQERIIQLLESIQATLASGKR